jgi:hypothetical protein
MHQLPAFASVQRAGDLPVTESLSERIVGLPMANDISAGSLERIRDLVLRTVASAPRRPRHTASPARSSRAPEVVPHPRRRALVDPLAAPYRPAP